MRTDTPASTSPATPAGTKAAPSPRPAPASNGHAAAAGRGPAHEPDPLEIARAAKKPGIAWIVITLLVVLLGLGVLLVVGILPKIRRNAALEAQVKQQQDATPVVNVIHPRPVPATSDLKLPGTVQAFQETMIYAQTNGYLRKWYVDIGDRVKAGQALADIETPEVDQQLEQAQAAVAQGNAKVNTSQTDVKLAQQTWDRYSAAAKAGVYSQQDTDEKRAALESSKSNLVAAQADAQAMEAALHRVEKLKQFAHVTAPFDGVVTARSIEVGQLVTAGNGTNQQLFRVAQTDPVRIFIDVPQTYAPRVDVGIAASLLLREYPGKEFVGKVARTAHALDPNAHTLRTEVDIPNPKGQLLPGMYAQVKLSVPNASNSVVVPVSGLIFNAQGNQLAVVDDQDVAHFKPITIDTDFGSEISVSTGVTAADRVISNPGERLVDGIKVKVAPAPAASQPGK